MSPVKKMRSPGGTAKNTGVTPHGFTGKNAGVTPHGFTGVTQGFTKPPLKRTNSNFSEMKSGKKPKHSK